MPVGPPNESQFEDLPSLEEELERLKAYQQSRDAEEARVKAALAVPKDQRTKAQAMTIAHSTFGTANPHNF